ncbi:MAG: hypothetical protein IJY14_00900 [Acholeplasmatales bacterium]|nr:hypothetical protein [Acholeplasmatales bacterium]
MEKNPIQNFVNYFFSLSPYEFSILANLIGIFLTIPLDVNQQNSLGNFFELIGQQILTIQAQNYNINDSININFNEILKQINFKFEYLEELINYLMAFKDKK